MITGDQQAKLLSELDSANNYYLDCECYCDSPSHQLCVCQPDDPYPSCDDPCTCNDDLSTTPSDLPREFSPSASLKHSFSLTFDDQYRKVSFLFK